MGVLDNGGLGSLGTGQDQQSPVPAAQGNDIVSQLIAKLAQAQGSSLQRKALLPQQLPPQHVQAGDVRGNFVNPSTLGGPARNSRVSMAQAIGQVAAQAINKHEDKEARDLSFNIQTVESAYNTLNDPNATPQEKQMATQQLNNIDKATWKKMQKALNIQFFGGEDKRTNVEKKAVGMAKIGSQSQSSQQQNSQPMSESLGMPQGLNPMAQQFMNKVPTQLGLTPSAMAVAELTKSGALPNAGEILRFASDQQYYKVMEDKMGVEAASKAAETARKAQADYEKYETQLAKLTTDKEIADKKLEIQEMFHRAHDSLVEQRLALMKEQIDNNKTKDDTKADIDKQKNTITKLGTAAKSENNRIKTLQKDKDVALKHKDTATATQIDVKIRAAQDNLSKINQQLDSVAFGGDDKAGLSDEDYLKYQNALDGKLQ